MGEAAAVVVVGGGVIGSSIAVRLRQRMRGARIVVVERDPTYARASSRLATGGIRQQYDSALNVAMAQYGIAFYRRFDELTAALGHRSRAWFRQRGYLFLADEGNADRLDRRYETQKASGAHVERLSQREVADRFAGLATHDVRFGIFGAEDGYLDPREVLTGLRAMASSTGAEYVHGTVTEVVREGGRAAGVRVSGPDGGGDEREISAPVVVNAAGAYAAAVGQAAGLTLPIDPVRQHLFRLVLEEPLPCRIPMVFDPDGTHWRLDDPISAIDTETLVIGRSRAEEPVGENFECDHARLQDEMLPTFMRRHPEVRVCGVADGWAGLYEMTPDHNALLGEHPALPGFVTAAGFSGHGLMMAPATGLAIAELIADGRSHTFDVAPLAVDRFERGQPFMDGALV
jgi:glycine/D-amino acid oxidase-like deaminating enzyme